MGVLKKYPEYLTKEYKATHLANDIVGRHPNGYNVLDTIIALEKGKVIQIIDDCQINTSGENIYNSPYVDIKNGGNIIVIDHGNGYKTRYLHLGYGTIKVSLNQIVNKGEEIAYMGNTGYSFGGHLHFEVEKDGVKIDPYEYAFNDKTFISLPTPVERNENTVQIEVIESQLNCRVGHGTNYESIGFIPIGIYNILNTYIGEDYVWYEVEGGKWIANNGEWIRILGIVVYEEEEKNESDEIPDYYESKEKNNVLLWIFQVIIKFFKKIFKS